MAFIDVFVIPMLMGVNGSTLWLGQVMVSLQKGIKTYQIHASVRVVKRLPEIHCHMSLLCLEKIDMTAVNILAYAWVVRHIPVHQITNY